MALLNDPKPVTGAVERMETAFRIIPERSSGEMKTNVGRTVHVAGR